MLIYHPLTCPCILGVLFYKNLIKLYYRIWLKSWIQGVWEREMCHAFVEQHHAKDKKNDAYCCKDVQVFLFGGWGTKSQKLYGFFQMNIFSSEDEG